MGGLARAPHAPQTRGAPRRSRSAPRISPQTRGAPRRSRSAPRISPQSSDRLQTAPVGSDETVEGQDDHGADDGHDEAGRFTLSIQPQHSADPAAQEGADDAEHDGEDDATRIV